MIPTLRNESYSLINSDIKGAVPKQLIPKTVKRATYAYTNLDIDRSSPKKLYPSIIRYSHQ